MCSATDDPTMHDAVPCVFCSYPASDSRHATAATAWGAYAVNHVYSAIESEDDTPRCDICGEPDDPGVPDWNGETGNHASCEAGNREGDPAWNGAFDRW